MRSIPTDLDEVSCRPRIRSLPSSYIRLRFSTISSCFRGALGVVLHPHSQPEGQAKLHNKNGAPNDLHTLRSTWFSWASPSSNQYYLLHPCIVCLRCLCLLDIAKLSVVVVVTKVRASSFA